MVAVVVLYPHFRDAVDPDGTSYLWLARRWVAGDWSRAANGYWSPWSIWLTAAGMRLGLPEIPAAGVQSTVGALLFLWASLRLFGRLALPLRQQAWFTAGLAGFLLYALFVQWFNDLWTSAFLLLSLEMLLDPAFGRSKRAWVLHGVFGALAYFAKAYSLPFFALSTMICGWWITGGDVRRWVALIAVSGGVAAMVCLPWWMALHARYGFWTLGTAGALNLSWGLLGHPIFVDGPQSLLPPPYPDSIVFWEDPATVNVRMVHFWDSPRMALEQVLRLFPMGQRLGHNAFVLSLALPVAAWHSARVLFRKAGGAQRPQLRILALQILLFPAGFILVHSESRYFWYLVPVVAAFAGLWMPRRTRLQAILIPAVALSFWVDPLLSVSQLWEDGRADKAAAARLVAAGLRGGFATSGPALPPYAACCRIAYFSGVPYWAGAGDCRSPEIVAREMRRHDVRFRLTHSEGARPLAGERLRFSGSGFALFEQTGLDGK